MMILRIAWRNLWRNRTRSLIVLTSVVLGVAALVFTDAVTLGMIRQMLDNRIANHVGHIQVHAEGFRDDPSLDRIITDPSGVEFAASRDSLIIGFAQRVTTFGLSGTAYNTAGAAIIGIDPSREQRITSIHQNIVEGRYLAGTDREILMSRRLATRLQASLGDKVVLTASRLDGSVGTDVFRVVGLYKTFDSAVDEAFVFIPIQRAQAMLGLGGAVTECVARVSNPDEAVVVSTRLQAALPLLSKL